MKTTKYNTSDNYNASNNYDVFPLRILHPLVIFILMLSVLIPLFLTSKPLVVLSFASIGLFYLLNFKVDIKVLLILSLALIPVSSSILILNILYPSKSIVESGDFYIFFKIKIYKQAFYNGFTLFLRLYLISIISISTTTVIDFFKLIYCLMQQFKFPLNIGYPVFIAINAIMQSIKEYERIKIVKKLRGGKSGIFSMFLPLLVYAIRFSERSSIAILSKGFTAEKIFYFNYSVDILQLKKAFLISGLNILFFIFAYLIF